MTDYFTEIQAATEFAQIAHADQTEFAGSPYIDHPIRVANIVRPLGVSYQIAALLHDTIEDSAVTLTDLSLRFGSCIVKAVDIVSRRPEDDSYAAFITRIVRSHNIVAIAVKTADVLDHLRPESKDFFLARPTMESRYLSAICRLRAAANTV